MIEREQPSCLFEAWSEYRYPQPATDEPTARFLRAAAIFEQWAAQQVIAKLQEIADQYPADVVTPDGQDPDGLAGIAIRERMLAEIRRLAGS